MSWTKFDDCMEITFVRYMCVMHLYIDGGTPQWFKKQFKFAPTTIHTIVSNVRNWMVTQNPDVTIDKPREMQNNPEKYHEILNVIETNRTKKPATSPTEYAAIFAEKRTFGPRRGSVRQPKHIKILGLTKPSPNHKATPEKKLTSKGDIVEHLLTAAAEISEGSLGVIEGVVLIAVSNGSILMTNSGLSYDQVDSALAKAFKPKPKEPVSVFKTL